MESRCDQIGRPPRPPRLDRPALATLLVLALAPLSAEAGPIRDRAQAIAARVTSQQALLQPDAGTLRAAALSSRNQAFQLRRASILDSQSFRRQEAFYAQALQQGLTTVPRPQFLDTLLVPDVSGLLPESSVVDYLNWRRSLNSARFDRNHPLIGPILERDRIVRNQVPIPVPPATPDIPTIPPANPDDPDQPIPPRSPQLPVPEPSSIALWASLALGGAFAVHRRRRTLR